MDQRKAGGDLIRTDTIMIAHIPASHDAVYMVSLPRDSKVEIPPFEETGYLGGTDKINAAFAIANRTRNAGGGLVGDPSTAGRQRGVKLVAQTIDGLIPGGIKFNAVAIINFLGFRNILDAIDGVDMCIDTETRSVHFDSNNKYHTNEVPYAQRKIYKVGCRHLQGWEALDFSRQRHFANGDYTRQVHQQQVLMAIFKKLTSKGVITDIGKLTELQKVAGDLLTLDLGPNSTRELGLHAQGPPRRRRRNDQDERWQGQPGRRSEDVDRDLDSGLPRTAQGGSAGHRVRLPRVAPHVDRRRPVTDRTGRP